MSRPRGERGRGWRGGLRSLFLNTISDPEGVPPLLSSRWVHGTMPGESERHPTGPPLISLPLYRANIGLTIPERRDCRCARGVHLFPTRRGLVLLKETKEDDAASFVSVSMVTVASVLWRTLIPSMSNTQLVNPHKIENFVPILGTAADFYPCCRDLYLHLCDSRRVKKSSVVKAEN